MKDIKITYHMLRGYHDPERGIDGTEDARRSVTLRMADCFAENLVSEGIGGYAYQGNVHGILERLATIQGYVYNGEFEAKEVATNNGTGECYQ